jgi:hypothetical protein
VQRGIVETLVIRPTYINKIILFYFKLYDESCDSHSNVTITASVAISAVPVFNSAVNFHYPQQQIAMVRLVGENMVHKYLFL